MKDVKITLRNGDEVKVKLGHLSGLPFISVKDSLGDSATVHFDTTEQVAEFVKALQAVSKVAFETKEETTTLVNEINADCTNCHHLLIHHHGYGCQYCDCPLEPSEAR